MKFCPHEIDTPENCPICNGTDVEAATDESLAELREFCRRVKARAGVVDVETEADEDAVRGVIGELQEKERAQGFSDLPDRQQAAVDEIHAESIAVVAVIDEGDGTVSVLSVCGHAGGAHPDTRGPFPGYVWLAVDVVTPDGRRSSAGMGRYPLARVDSPEVH